MTLTSSVSQSHIQPEPPQSMRTDGHESGSNSSQTITTATFKYNVKTRFSSNLHCEAKNCTP